MVKYMGHNVRKCTFEQFMSIRKIVLLECIMFLECISLYLTRLFRIFEPRREKTGLRGFRPGPTQTGMYSHRKELEA